MAKAYWIGRIDVHDRDGYSHYVAANPAIIKKFGGQFLVRSGKFESEGQSRAHNVVIQFPDYETAIACYRSPEYQENIKRRTPHSTAEIVIIEGYDSPSL
jgi:uncharacterized protein (DUF1330 family)